MNNKGSIRKQLPEVNIFDGFLLEDLDSKK